MLMNISNLTINLFRYVCVLVVAAVMVGCSSAPKQEPVEHVQPVTEADPRPTLNDQEKARYQEGLKFIAEQSYDDAKPIFDELIAQHPRLAGAYVNLGLISQAKGDVDDAVASYNEALKINPENVNAAVQLSLIHQADGKFRESEKLLLNAISSKPDNALANYNLGVLYELYLRDYGKAIEHYRVYLKSAEGDDKKTVERWIKLLERK